MTRDDIIKAAFKVWGQDFYRTTSLTQLAEELAVSKPALYRHFKDKDALIEAMFAIYFDDFALFAKESYDRAISSANRQKGILVMMRSVTEYYARKREFFIFSLTRVFDSRERKNINMEFCKRGIDFTKLSSLGNDNTAFPSKVHLVMTTLIYCVAQFHLTEKTPDKLPSEEKIRNFLLETETWITKGLNLESKKVSLLAYEALEKQITKTAFCETEDGTLLKAVAEAVAEAGPWNVSMEMVAKRSGLSKSSLYSHFKSKQDMLGRLFMTEFSVMMDYAKLQIEKTEKGEEQLYLTIISIVNYLQSKPEILLSMDWLKTRRMDLGTEAIKRLHKTIESLNLKAVKQFDKRRLLQIANWVLFMVVSTLTWWPRVEGLEEKGSKKSKSFYKGPESKNDLIKKMTEIPNESFRILFRFISLGLEGLK